MLEQQHANEQLYKVDMFFRNEYVVNSKACDGILYQVESMNADSIRCLNTVTNTILVFPKAFMRKAEFKEVQLCFIKLALFRLVGLMEEKKR